MIALLERIDAPVFRAAECWFGDESAVSLRCEEFRVSRDVGFLCASRDGHRMLRERVHRDGAQGLFRSPVTLVREARVDRYGIRMAIENDQPWDTSSWEVYAIDERTDLCVSRLATRDAPVTLPLDPLGRGARWQHRSWRRVRSSRRALPGEASESVVRSEARAAA